MPLILSDSQPPEIVNDKQVKYRVAMKFNTANGTNTSVQFVTAPESAHPDVIALLALAQMNIRRKERVWESDMIETDICVSPYGL